MHCKGKGAAPSALGEGRCPVHPKGKELSTMREKEVYCPSQG